MVKVIEHIISNCVLFKSNISYEIREGYENLWVDNPEEVAGTIISHLRSHGYVITKSDDLDKARNAANDAGWREDYRRGMSF